MGQCFQTLRDPHSATRARASHEIEQGATLVARQSLQLVEQQHSGYFDSSERTDYAAIGEPLQAVEPRVTSFDWFGLAKDIHPSIKVRLDLRGPVEQFLASGRCRDRTAGLWLPFESDLIEVAR